MPLVLRETKTKHFRSPVAPIPSSRRPLLELAPPAPSTSKMDAGAASAAAAPWLQAAGPRERRAAPPQLAGPRRWPQGAQGCTTRCSPRYCRSPSRHTRGLRPRGHGATARRGPRHRRSRVAARGAAPHFGATPPPHAWGRAVVARRQVPLQRTIIHMPRACARSCSFVGNLTELTQIASRDWWNQS